MYDNIIEIDVLKIFLFNFDTQAIYVAKHMTTVKMKVHHEYATVCSKYSWIIHILRNTTVNV